MKEGFYWVRPGNEPLQVWYYLPQFGWYRPQSAIPITAAYFRQMDFEIIGNRLLPPSSPDMTNNMS
ncbi:MULTISPECIES: hypothetical protein [Pantoea]|uniref:hypothetical protein n=1 Tax=Pantoea TaxID=53335 RepID=UPI000FD6BA04|nr:MULTISPECIES: hypothetical protein [Pantoea]